MVSPRSAMVILALSACVGCSSLSQGPKTSEKWSQDLKDTGSAVARGASAGAKVAGSAASEAFHGVTNGYEDPDDAAYGPYPKDFARVIRKHLVRFADVPPDANLAFGKPVKAYMNHGILAGGGIAWQGWVVDVEVRTTSALTGATKSRAYVVRLTRGEVEEVHEAEYASFVQRVAPRPAARAHGS